MLLTNGRVITLTITDINLVEPSEVYLYTNPVLSPLNGGPQAFCLYFSPVFFYSSVLRRYLLKGPLQFIERSVALFVELQNMSV